MSPRRPTDHRPRHRAMVAAPQPDAVEAGVNVLAQGGSAIDAAIACALMQGVVDPLMCGVAGLGVLGVIPGTMGAPGYVVRGRGGAGSLASASHGAGRTMSSPQAKERITKTERDRYLAARGVRLVGEAGLDEAPQADKRVEAIIAAQADLVEIIGTFAPRLVRMTGEKGDI